MSRPSILLVFHDASKEASQKTVPSSTILLDLLLQQLCTVYCIVYKQCNEEVPLWFLFHYYFWTESLGKAFLTLFSPSVHHIAKKSLPLLQHNEIESFSVHIFADSIFSIFWYSKVDLTQSGAIQCGIVLKADSTIRDYYKESRNCCFLNHNN